MIYFAFRELEPYAVKVASTVLRGLGGSNAARLPDLGCFFSGASGTVVVVGVQRFFALAALV